MDASPQRIVARATAVLGAAGAFDASPLRIDCGHVQVVTLTINYTSGAAGGAPQFQAEVFDGIIWRRITIENVGTLTIVGNNGDGSGTTSAVDQTLKRMTPRAIMSEEYAFVINKRVYAIRFNFAEYVNILAPDAPGTLGAVVILSSE